MKIAAIALSALAPFAAADETASTDKVTVEFIGASGGLKLFPKADSNGFIMVQQAKLEEVASDGGKVSGGTSINVAGQNSWTALSTTETEGKTVYSTTFSKTSGDTSFELTAHLARETTTATENVPCNNCTDTSVGGCQRASDMACAAVVEGACTEGYERCIETVPVIKDELKFSIVVDGFPFKDAANKLQYQLSIKDKNGDVGTMELEDGGDAKIKRTSLSGALGELQHSIIQHSIMNRGQGIRSRVHQDHK